MTHSPACTNTAPVDIDEVAAAFAPDSDHVWAGTWKSNGYTALLAASARDQGIDKPTAGDADEAAARFVPNSDMTWEWAFPDPAERERWQASEQVWDGTGTWSLELSAVEAYDWNQAGISRDAMVHWQTCRFDLDAAAEWAQTGATPGDAYSCRARGISATTRHPWHLADLSPNEMFRWIAVGVTNPTHARVFTNRGDAPAQVADWLNIGWTAERLLARVDRPLPTVTADSPTP